MVHVILATDMYGLNSHNKGQLIIVSKMAKLDFFYLMY